MTSLLTTFKSLFKAVNGEEQLVSVQRRDRILDEHITRNGWTLVRISYDQFSYKNNGHFIEECLTKLFNVLDNPIPGVHFIGDVYNQHV